jgi:hypothetical protein
MSRISGKNGKLRGVLARTLISVDTAMVDSGDHKTYSYQSRWNPNLYPVIKKNTVLVATSAYTVDYIAGTITFAVANLITDAITVNGIEWMSMQDVGDLFNWTLNAKVNVVDTTAFQDQFKEKRSSFREWSASAESYHVSGYWFDAFSGEEFYVELYPDANETERWVGAVFVDDAPKVKMDAAVTETLGFTGTGALQRLTS